MLKQLGGYMSNRWDEEKMLNNTCYIEMTVDTRATLGDIRHCLQSASEYRGLFK